MVVQLYLSHQKEKLTEQCPVKTHMAPPPGCEEKYTKLCMGNTLLKSFKSNIVQINTFHLLPAVRNEIL